MLTLGAIPWWLARRDPGARALRADDHELDAATLDVAAARAAEWLRRRGVGTGDRVALICGNGLALPVAYYGCLRLGAVVAPLSTASSAAELSTAIRRLRVRAVVSDEESAAAAGSALRGAASAAGLHVLTEGPARRRHEVGLGTLAAGRPGGCLADPVPVPPGAAAVILATSGTTGLPKRAVHSHAGLLLNATAVAGEVLGLSEADCQLAALPLAHSFGMSAVLNASLLAGAGVVVLRRFDAAAALAAIDEHRITVLQGVPTMLARLGAAARVPPPSLRLAVVSGAPLPAGLGATLRVRLCDRIVERYGMTECSPLTARELSAADAEPGDVGRPLRGVVVRTVGGAEEGELEAAAPSMFLGYHRDPRGTRAALVDGFLRTGDRGHVAPDGRVVLGGRLKDVIVRGGNNVNALEVERVLEAHPDVVEAAVVGIPDRDLGEEVAVAVVLRPRRGSDDAIVERLGAHCRERLSSYKVPRRWTTLAALPRSPTGKLRKDEVRSLLDPPPGQPGVGSPPLRRGGGG